MSYYKKISNIGDECEMNIKSQEIMKRLPIMVVLLSLVILGLCENSLN